MDVQQIMALLGKYVSDDDTDLSEERLLRAIRDRINMDLDQRIAERICGDDELDEPDDRCTNPKGHEYEYTGTAYGGDDTSYHGEGRCYCIYCGADGDG